MWRAKSSVAPVAVTDERRPSSLERWRQRLEQIFHRPAAPAMAEPVPDATEAGATFWVELPGFGPKDVTLQVQGKILDVRAAKRLKVRRGPRVETLRVARHRIRLPENLDGTRAHAVMQDGLLRVEVPYRRGWRRQIPVEAA